MSSRRRHAYDKGLFYPSIKCNHPPTYRQKKGMILQKGPSLPADSFTNSSYQSEVVAIRKSLKSNILKNISSTFDLPIPANTSYIQSLEYNTIIPIIKRKYGIIDDSKILSLSVDQFILAQGFQELGYRVPTINWTYHCGGSSITPNSVSTGQSSTMDSIPFNMPTPDYTNGYNFTYLRGPYFKRANDKYGGFVANSICYVTGNVNDFKNYLAKDVGPLYWFLYRPDIAINFLHTDVVINNDLDDGDDVLRIHFNLQYIA